MFRNADEGGRVSAGVADGSLAVLVDSAFVEAGQVSVGADIGRNNEGDGDGTIGVSVEVGDVI